MNTLDALPHFQVLEVKKSQAPEINFELSGLFDRTDGVEEGACSLLLPGEDVFVAIRADLKFFGCYSKNWLVLDFR